MCKKEYGKIIREYRKNRNMTQKELSGEIDVCRHTLAKWEIGTHVPCKASIRQIKFKTGLTF